MTKKLWSGISIFIIGLVMIIFLAVLAAASYSFPLNYIGVTGFLGFIKETNSAIWLLSSFILIMLGATISIKESYSR